MTKVIKRGGRKQSFSPSKLKKSVERACRDAKLSSGKKKEILKEVVVPTITLIRKKGAVKAVDIRKVLLKKLGRRSKSVVNAWRSFEKRKK